MRLTIIILSFILSVAASAHIDSLAVDSSYTSAGTTGVDSIAAVDAPSVTDTLAIADTLAIGMPVNTLLHPYYNFKREMTYAGIPLFVSSFIIKQNKKGFRSARFDYQKRFKSEVDNYTQYAPYAAIVGMKLAGYHGRSDWGRFLVSTAFSNIAMATAVNAMKYSVKEMRPDNSTRNSFPSGHTATAFVAATILHKEYGLTRSPWFSVGGYAVATATGLMRVLNNRHWMSDVVAGAGIGILATELGYYAADLIFRNRGVKHYELDDLSNPDHPSFFDIQMGVGLHPKSLDFNSSDAGGVLLDRLEFGTSTVFGVETAYFLNKYIGVGLMGRVTATPSRALNFDEQRMGQISDVNRKLAMVHDDGGKSMPGVYSVDIKDNNFSDVSLDAGIYFNLPIARRLAAGAKLLVGGRLCNGVNYSARNGLPKVDDTYHIADRDGNQQPLYWFIDGEGNEFRSNEVLMPGVSREYNLVLTDASEEFDLVSVKGRNAFNCVAGVNLTWRYKTNFAWKVFFDFDTAHNRYTYTGRFLSDDARKRIAASDFPVRYPAEWNMISRTFEATAARTFNLLTLGGSFTVCF